MIRKRSRWDRRNDRWRKRLKTPAPTTGWLVSELASLTELSHSAIRYYLKRGIISPPPFRGTATRYQRLHLLRLLAMQRLRTKRGVTLATVRKRLDEMSEVELVALVSENGLSESLAVALELSSPAGVELSGTLSFNRAEPSTEGWHRLPLLPGLELHVAASASPLLHRLARQIHAECVGGDVRD